MGHSEWFVVDTDGACRWSVSHALTGEPAGMIVRTPGGYVLKDDRDHTIGTFPTKEHAVEGLYEFV